LRPRPGKQKKKRAANPEKETREEKGGFMTHVLREKGLPNIQMKLGVWGKEEGKGWAQGLHVWAKTKKFEKKTGEKRKGNKVKKKTTESPSQDTRGARERTDSRRAKKKLPANTEKSDCEKRFGKMSGKGGRGGQRDVQCGGGVAGENGKKQRSQKRDL